MSAILDLGFKEICQLSCSFDHRVPPVCFNDKKAYMSLFYA